MLEGRHDNVKRILAIGDIHGCYPAFDALLEAVNPGPDDLVITLGDYIDRGPDAKRVIDRLLRLQENSLVVPPAHWEFFENCRDRFETGGWIFVHGQVDPHLTLAEQSTRQLHWARFSISQKPHISGKKVICGHPPQADGIPTDIGHTVCIDTYLYGGR